jgi:hypothetical protein
VSLGGYLRILFNTKYIIIIDVNWSFLITPRTIELLFNSINNLEPLSIRFL